MSETTPNTNPTGGEQERSEVRENLREAGDALVAAGSAIGTAIGKATGELSDRFKTATESARQNLAQAKTDHDVRNAASGFTDEAERLFNNLRERDVTFTDDMKAKVRDSIADARRNFNERMDTTETAGTKSAFDDVRERFDGLMARVQDQFGDKKQQGDIIDADIVDNEDLK